MTIKGEEETRWKRRGRKGKWERGKGGRENKKKEEEGGIKKEGGRMGNGRGVQRRFKSHKAVKGKFSKITTFCFQAENCNYKYTIRIGKL